MQTPALLATFAVWLSAAGSFAAAALVASLTFSLRDARWRIWPAPPAGSARSFLFWSLFRVLNGAVLALAALALTDSTPHLLRAPLLAISMLAFAVYLYALWTLGRSATYCRASGLQTGTLYRWSRNPQYAAAIVAFAGLGLAIATPAVTGLSLGLVLVYALMARVEEPWLEAKYGSAYRDYRRGVPRFFNLALLFAAGRGGAPEASTQPR